MVLGAAATAIIKLSSAFGLFNFTRLIIRFGRIKNHRAERTRYEKREKGGVEERAEKSGKANPRLDAAAFSHHPCARLEKIPPISSLAEVNNISLKTRTYDFHFRLQRTNADVRMCVQILF